MNAKELADFLSTRHVRSTYSLTAVGLVEAPRMATRFIAEGNKMACVIEGPQQHTYVGIYVHRIIDVAPTKFRVVCDDPFPEQAIDFEVIPAGDKAGNDAFIALLDEIDDDEDEVTKRLHEVLARVPDPVTPALNEAVRFVRWAKLDPANNGIVGCGVITHAPDGGLFAQPFPGFEDQAADWRDLRDDGKAPPLEDLPNHAGRTTIISHPETIKGADFNDAALRALHKFAADIYQQTGRSAFA